MNRASKPFTFVVDAEIERDIEDCFDDDPDQAAMLVAIIDEMRGDNRLCECLVDKGYEDEQIRSVKFFERLQQQGYNAYTVRCWEVDDWRIITGVDHRQRVVAVLYLMKRTENYDEVASQRVIEAYDRLNLRKLGR